MMRDDYFRLTSGGGLHGRAQGIKLAPADPAIFPSQGARRVHTRHDELGIDEHGLEIVRDIAAITIEFSREAREEVVQRNIVITRHDDLGERDPAEEFLRGRVFRGPRALGQIA